MHRKQAYSAYVSILMIAEAPDISERVRNAVERMSSALCASTRKAAGSKWVSRDFIMQEDEFPTLT